MDQFNNTSIYGGIDFSLEAMDTPADESISTENTQPVSEDIAHVLNLTKRIHTTYRDIIILFDELEHWDLSLSEALDTMDFSDLEFVEAFNAVTHNIQIGTTITWFTGIYVSHIRPFYGGIDYLNIWKNNSLMRVECNLSESNRFVTLLSHAYPGDMILFLRTDWNPSAVSPFAAGPMFCRSSNLIILPSHVDDGIIL